MARRKQSELGDVATRDRILESAKKYFLEYGFQASPLRKIAADAGFTSGALFGYFDSKEELFYALTDPVAEKTMEKLNSIQKEMESLPAKEKLYGMGKVYYPHIPEIVDILISDRDAVKLIVNNSKGTRYENFIDNISHRNSERISRAAKSADKRVAKTIEQQTMDVMVEGYIATLFRLVTSDRERETIIKCMEMIGKVYEAGILSVMGGK